MDPTSASAVPSRRVTLANIVPQGREPQVDDFVVVDGDDTVPADSLEGYIHVQAKVLSVDPYMRGRIGGDPSCSSSQPLKVGDTIVGASVGQVLESHHPSFEAGDVVHAYAGWRESYWAKPADVEAVLVRPHEKLGLEKYVGPLGMTGLTAFYGLFFVGKAKAGETVVVSGAAGAVGQIVCQLAKKVLGCRVVAIAGTDEKLARLSDELGAADAFFNYKTTPVEEYGAVLSEACPDGVDVYYDNTGGVISDAVIPLINHKARIVICGQISQYSKPTLGPRLNHHLLWKSAVMQGFLVQDFIEKDADTLQKLEQWIIEGLLVTFEDVEAGGIEAAPAAFVKLFQGKNVGKQVVML